MADRFPEGHHWIGGRWLAGEREAMASRCPATGLTVWEGRAASTAQVDQACSSARSSFSAWAHASLESRSEVVVRFKQALTLRAEELARTISREIGKPLWESRSEVTTMVNKVDISLRAHVERTGSKRTLAADGHNLLAHRPHGVLAVLGPYNFPGHLPNGHIVPALIAGNAVVFKPSEYAPATALLTARCWDEAGLPAGVLNVLNGGRETGMALVAHEQVDGVLFTGSHATGAALSRHFAGRPEKMLALEMGGNNPLVVWDVQNIDAAALAIVQSAFISAGQRCTCARRLIVPEGPQGDAVLQRVMAWVDALRVGPWDASPPPFMGPVVSAGIADGLLASQAALLGLGARPLRLMQTLNQGTALLSPGILDVTGVEGLPDEEIFGPLLQVHRVSNFDDAVVLANRSRYGLAAGLLSDSEALWRRFWAEARAGVVNWNKPTTGAASTAPFGGIGWSGNHRASAYYAADYCAYPVAGMAADKLAMPSSPLPGLPSFGS